MLNQVLHHVHVIFTVFPEIILSHVWLQRILELESSLDKISQDGSSLSHELSGQLGELKDKHKEQISALEEKH